ncbi:hypothetical protein [Thermococcus sp.]|uniref:hypothetical protein n=1 Tax=Thermococcus sp. TaxID=35749 RepID=UPI00262E3DF1|nr:hypothetical protein [Thermococcus sp.]
MAIDIDEALKKPVGILEDNYSFFVLPLIPAAIDLLTGSVRRPGGMFELFFSAYGLLSFLAFLVGIWVMGGLVRMAEEQLRGGRPDYNVGLQVISERWADFTVAAVIIAVGTFVGLLLFIIPGLLWLMFVAFTLPIMVVKNLDAVAAIGESINLVRENLNDVFLYLLVLVVLMALVDFVLSLIPYIGGAIATIIIDPYAALSVTIAYHQLEGGDF